MKYYHFTLTAHHKPSYFWEFVFSSSDDYLYNSKLHTFTYWFANFTRFFLCFYFYFFDFWLHLEACTNLVPWPRIEPVPPAVEGGVLTIGPPGKSLICPF